jgi:hypothetical protein
MASSSASRSLRHRADGAEQAAQTGFEFDSERGAIIGAAQSLPPVVLIELQHVAHEGLGDVGADGRR